MESGDTNEKNKYLDRLKLASIKGGEKKYPTLNLMIRDTIKSRHEVDNKFIFGYSIGSRLPFFTFNIKLEKIYEYFDKLISKIPDEILLENIKLLDEVVKKSKLTSIDDLTGVGNFKSNLSSPFFFVNKSHVLYKELLKKLFLFSTSLYEAVFEEFRKYRIEKKELKLPSIIDGVNIEELQIIDDIIRSNMKYISTQLELFKKIPNYDISGIENRDNNIYQVVSGVLVVKSPSSELYEKDYGSDLELFKEKFKSAKVGSGNFYILMKRDEKNTSLLLGDFNSYLECSITKKKDVFDDLSCPNRSKNILKLWESLMSKISKKGGKTKRFALHKQKRSTRRKKMDRRNRSTRRKLN